MDSRFKFLQSVDPQKLPNTAIKPKFSKLTLASTKHMKVESTKTNTGIKITQTVTHTTTTTTTMAAKALEPVTTENEGTLQKPKILLYDSTLKSTVKSTNDSDILTDDDTDSVGSSIDTELLHKELEISQTQATQGERVDIVDEQMQNLSIIGSPKLEKSARQAADGGNLHNLSHQFGQLDLLPDSKANRKSDESADISVHTLSSSDDTLDQEALSQPDIDNTECRSNVVIDLCDSGDENELSGRESKHFSAQPPLKQTPINNQDSAAFNVSAIASQQNDYPNSTEMEKVNNFFDNVPSLDTAEDSFNTTVLSKSPKEADYVSETSDEESIVKDDASDSHKDTSKRDENQVAIDVQEFSDNNIIVDIPVKKSCSDQPRQLVRSQSGVRLKESLSSPIIKTATATVSSDCVKRTSSNIVLKNAGSLIKVNSSNGQVNISAKININIHFSPAEESSSEETESGEDKNKKGRESQAIESSEPISESEKQKPSDSDKNSSSNEAGSSSAKKSKSPASVKSQNSPVNNHLKLNDQVSNVKTPTTASKIKRFEFVPPKSMTKTKPQTPKNPPPTTDSELPDTVDLNTKDANAFEVDESIPVHPRDQRLLHKVYGDAWKTPDIIRSYSAIKGAPKDRPATSTSPAYQSSRISKGFNLFKRNIACDLDSTRVDDIAEISVIEPIEPKQVASPKKVPKSAQNALRDTPKKTPQAKPQSTSKKQATQQSLDVDVQPSPSVINKPKARKINKPAAECPSTASKRPQRKVNRRRVIDSSSGDECSDKENSQKTKSKASDDDYSTESSDPMTNDSDSSDDFVAPKPTPRKRVGDTAKTPRRKKDSNDLVYLDLSSEEVHEVDKDFHQDASEEDLANITRKFLGTNICDEEEKPKKKVGRKLFTPMRLDNDEDTIQEESPKTRRKKQGEDAMVNIEIPRFHKLFEGKKFGTQSPCGTPKSKSVEQIDIFKTPVSKQLSLQNDQLAGSARSILDSAPKTFTTYSFLKSLDVCASQMLCHPDALIYRNNFKAHREKLTDILLKMFNDDVFDGKLKIPCVWNKKLTMTAGRFHGKPKWEGHIELSEKVLTSADRLRCTLIHELCHAAVWMINKEKGGGHGATWKAWAKVANKVYPELPLIERCHNYEIEFKYTYQCDLCHSKSSSHTKSKKVENIRCSYCYGSISIYLNKKQKNGIVTLQPIREASGFAKFVKEKYKDFKEPGVTHAEVMRLISTAFAALSVDEKKKY